MEQEAADFPADRPAGHRHGDRVAVAGVDHAPAVAGGGRRTAAADGLLLGSQRHAHARLDAQGRRPARGPAPDPRAAGAAQVERHGAQRADARRRAAAPRRSRRSRPRGRLVPHGGPSLQDHRQGHPQRRLRRSGGRGEGRPPDPLCLARIGLRAGRAGGQLRFGLQLRLFVEHLLADADLADEQRGQPAGRLRPPLRPGRADCRRPCAPRRTRTPAQEHSGLRGRGRRRPAAQTRPQRRPQARRVSVRRARDRAPPAEGRSGDGFAARRRGDLPARPRSSPNTSA